MTAAVPPTPPHEVDRIVTAAAAAQPALDRMPLTARADLLEAVAAAIDESAETLVALAAAESHLDPERLRGEAVRTAFQFRMLTGHVRSGRAVAAVIDHADPDWPPAPRPDLRKMRMPIGPVVVFEASNFPLAFGVAGTDTATALAAGCAVIVKAHSAHPRLAQATGEILAATLRRLGIPDGTFGLVFGTEAGRRALAHPDVAAGSFTGSGAGGRALYDIATRRENPIPFYAEMGSVNPVFVTEAALRERGDEIWHGFVASFTGSGGQLCTKPGVIAVPGALRESARRDALIAAAGPFTLLSETIHDGFARTVSQVASRVGVVTAASGPPEGAVLLEVRAADVLADPDAYLQEMFGPAALLVTYDDEDELTELVRSFPGQLTATIQQAGGEGVVAELLPVLSQIAGRVLVDSWPTGVSVTDAIHHGGPFPATASPHTSVGPDAIARFQRPVTFQNVPDTLLPAELRESNPARIERRVDGVPVPQPNGEGR